MGFSRSASVADLQETGRQEELRPMEFQMNSRREDGTLRLTLAGELNRSGTHEFKQWAVAQLEDGVDRVEIDCQALEYVDSAGLGAFIFLRQRVADHGGQLHLTRISGWLRKFLEVTGLLDAFNAAPA